MLFLGLRRARLATPLLLVGGFFLGIGGTAFAVGVPFVNAWFPPERRGLAIGVFGAGMGGTAISALTTVKLVDDSGAATPFVITAVVLAVYAVARLAAAARRPGPHRADRAALAPAARPTLRLPITWQASRRCTPSPSAAYVAFSVYLPTYLKTAYGLDARPTPRTGWPASSWSPWSMRPVGGWLSDRFGPIPVLAAGFAVVVVGAAVSPRDTRRSTPLGTVAFLAHGRRAGRGQRRHLRAGRAGRTGRARSARHRARRRRRRPRRLRAAAGHGLVYGAHRSYAIGLCAAGGGRRSLTAGVHLTAVRRAARSDGVTRRRPRRRHRPRPVTQPAAPGMDDGLTEALVRTRRFFTSGEVSDDLRTLHQIGGREADDFYRDRWSHDKVVRSTHGVNCTGSCSWKVYVKDGIITWESQQTDYPSVGPDSRSTSRAAALAAPRSPGTPTRPTRVRYPYVRGVLLEMYREAKARHAATRSRPGPTSSTTPSGRGATRRPAARAAWSARRWDEATEMVAAAHVHTIKQYGPDRVAGFSPIPAMSMVSPRRRAPGSSR